MTRASRIALGEIGFERAAVWSAVGFALSYAAFDAVTLVVPSGGSATGTVAMVSALVALTAVGVIAFVATGGGVLPATLLSYGPFAAVLLRTVGPEPYAIPFADPAPFLFAVAEPLGVALAGAVAVGLAGYAVGRVLLGLVGDDGTERTETDSASGPASAADAVGTDD